MAPEVIKKQPYTKSIDIWSCAILMYMLFNKGKHPLVDKNIKIQA
jgi:calcium-dependent protein kinase